MTVTSEPIAQAAQAPIEGVVRVPVEPTDDMMLAGERAFDRDPDLHHETVIAAIYRAMTAAAPTHPSGAAGVTREKIETAIADHIGRHDESVEAAARALLALLSGEGK
jgi:hypothetical protein